MVSSAVDRDQQQRRVAAFFDSHALDWKTIYERPGVYEKIHQQRRTRALRLIDGLALPAGSRVLEAGCGAGSIAVALAVRGLFVHATDAVAGMVSLTCRLAVEAKVEDRIRTSVADIRNLNVPDNTFDLVIALGVLPWIQPPLDPTVREIARVLKPGGRLVILEITRPTREPMASFYSVWFDHLVPWIGTIAGDSDAYSYLPESVKTFPEPEPLAAMIDAAGFEEIRWLLLAGGIIAVHSATLTK